MLAVKAVVMRLLRMVARGLVVGFVRGEVWDVGRVQAGVRMVFALGVVGAGGWG